VFLADDVLLFPFKSILTIFREIYNAAVQEMAGEAESIRVELSRLYQLLEQGAIDDETFDAQERELLDRLDTIETRDVGIGSEDDAGEDDASEEDTLEEAEDDHDVGDDT
jgi:Gas vesicle protein G